MVSDLAYRGRAKAPAPSRRGVGASIRLTAVRHPLISAALVIGAVKAALLMLDPGPFFFGGDSVEFLIAAVNRWVSDLRSFTYPAFIAVITHIWPSLTAVVVAQVIACWAAALAVNHIARTHLGCPRRPALLICCGLAVAPLGLYYERTIMTEALAFIVLALCVLVAAEYLSRPRAGAVILLHLTAVALVSLRAAYVPSVLTVLVALPLFPLLTQPWKDPERPKQRRAPVVTAFRHLLVGVLCVALFHTGYKTLLGHLTGREPAYQYWGGYFLLASWGSFAIPEDGADQRMVELLASPRAHLGDRSAVNDRIWAEDGLGAQVRALDPDPAVTERLARRTAYNAARRDPMAVVGYAIATWSDYLDPRGVDARLDHDRGVGHPLDPRLIRIVDEEFGFSAPPDWPNRLTPVRRWHARAGMWVHILALTPLLGLVAVASCDRSRRPTMVFLALLSLSMMTTTCTFGTSIVRYLQPQELFFVLFVVVLGRRAAELVASQLAAARYRRRLSADAASGVCSAEAQDHNPSSMRIVGTVMASWDTSSMTDAKTKTPRPARTRILAKPQPMSG